MGGVAVRRSTVSGTERKNALEELFRSGIDALEPGPPQWTSSEARPGRLSKGLGSESYRRDGAEDGTHRTTRSAPPAL